MNCPKCHSYVSGNICKNCDEVLIEKKAKSKVIAKRSDKGKAEDLVYAAKRLKFLKLNTKCVVFPLLASNQIHHKAGRLGKNYLDESTWLAVSFEGHNWIHNNDALAREKGWLLSRII